MRVIETSLEEDLSGFSRFLAKQGVPHRVFEERGQLILEVAHAQTAEPVVQAYEAWRRGHLNIEEPLKVGAGSANFAGGRQPVWISGLKRFPVMVIVLAISVVVYPFSAATESLDGLAGLMISVNLNGVTELNPMTLFTQGEYWRLLTPTFLHFSIVHLLFNCAVMFDFCKRIEGSKGSLNLLALVVAIGVISNVGQYMITLYPLFGGLSGVAYGLLGYILVMARWFPGEPAWQIPKAFAFSLLIFLVVLSTGITEPFGLHVANAAHWFGLITGATLGLLTALLSSGRRRSV